MNYLQIHRILIYLMQTLNPYILMIQEQFYELSQSVKLIDPIYLRYTAIPLVVIIPFFIGRLFHQKKLTHLLDHINNQQVARKQLSDDLTRSTNKIKAIKSKKKIAIVISLLFLLAIFIQIYQFQPAFIVDIFVLLFVALLWGFGLASIKYFQWKKKRSQIKLRSTNMTTQEEVRQILKELGPQIEEGLKYKFDRQVEAQRAREDREQCKLYKCFNQKKTLNQLYQVYKEIISELKKFPWCDICASQSNINAVQLRLTETENTLKICGRASIDSKIVLEQRKQIFNRLLKEWNTLSGKLSSICKRGCCLKVKTELDDIKNRYHGKIKAISAKMH